MSGDFPPAPFTGFPHQALAFFRDLAAHQDKAWFTEHRGVYESAVQAPIASLVTDVAAALAQRHVPLRGDAKRSVFRINHDVRFSKDKRPYKTHAGAVLTRTGDKKSPGLMYVHIDPEGCFMAAGFFRPDPPVLQLLRERLVAKPSAWTKAEQALASHGLELRRDDVLVRLPKGFDAVPESAEDVIRLKSWIVRRELPPGSIVDAGLVGGMADFAKQALPLLRFGWAALGVTP